jgi:chaperonin GroES
MKLNPLHDRVAVRRILAETKTASGFLIPETAAEKPDQGIILAVGQGKRTEEGTVIPLTVKVDDRVLFSKFAGQTVKIEGEDVLILKEEELFAIVEE